MASQVLNFRKDAMALGTLTSRNVDIPHHEAVQQEEVAEESSRKKSWVKERRARPVGLEKCGDSGEQTGGANLGKANHGAAVSH